MPEILPSSTIEGVIVVELVEHADRRGTFVEPWRREWFPGLPDMVQANHSEKGAGSLVGLHYHLHQADYWYVVSGRARVVLHDLRRSSATKNETLVLELSDEHRRGVYIPPGVGHGFAAHSALSLLYFVDRYYDPDDELGIAYDDPDLGLDWGLATPILSVRDERNPRLSEVADHLLPS